jgi:hypothetical protein
MTTEKHDPWTLLREARKTVWEWLEMSVPIDMDVLDRIDAALAERRDSAKDVVEWKQRHGSYIHEDGVNELRVHLWGDQWYWQAVVEYRANGICATEAEAKSAAIAAARGMR